MARDRDFRTVHQTQAVPPNIKSQVTFLTIGHDITGLFRNEWHSRIRTILKLVLTVALVEFVAPSKCESCWPTTGVSVLVTNIQKKPNSKTCKQTTEAEKLLFLS